MCGAVSLPRAPPTLVGFQLMEREERASRVTIPPASLTELDAPHPMSRRGRLPAADSGRQRVGARGQAGDQRLGAPGRRACSCQQWAVLLPGIGVIVLYSENFVCAVF